MEIDTGQECRFYASYSGVKLPLKLVNAIAAEALSNRNTFIRAWFDRSGALRRFDKIVYGEVELDSGALSRAEITMLDEEPVVLRFDRAGRQVAEEGS